MKSGSWKAVALAGGLALIALALGACGTDDNSESTEPPPPISVATAKQLASLSNGIAADLDAGDTCTAAARADDLADAIENARIDGRLRPALEEVAANLVNQVNCPPPPEPEEKKDEEKKDEEKKDEEKGKEGEDYEDAKLPGTEALPPGQRKQLEEGFD